MLLIICVERLLHIGSHFSLRKWRRRHHFLTKLAAVASFSYKIGGGGLIFQQNWRRPQGFGNITGGCPDMVWILGEARGAILNPGVQISKAGAEYNYSIYATRGQGRNNEVRDAILGPPGAGFFNYVSPGG